MPPFSFVAAFLIGLCFLILIGYLIYWGRIPKIPKGHQFTAKYRNCEALVIVDKRINTIRMKSTGKVIGFLVGGRQILGESMANACALAMYSAEWGFEQKKIEKAKEKIAIFHFKTSAEFDIPWRGLSKKWAAYSSITGGNAFGAGLPMAVIRARYINGMLGTGQPAIHEMIHILNLAARKNYNHVHDDKVLWSANSEKSVENLAVWKWSSLAPKVLKG